MEQSLTIYRASAGSGKTFTLAVEYILQLLAPYAQQEFEHTLAVTFTNKATAEMKGRILETLYGLKHNLLEAHDYMDELLKRAAETDMTLTPALISERAGKALTAILHDYSYFRVETIDAFFQSILRNMARELGLAANLQVELSHDEIVSSAVDSLIETMDSHPEVSGWVMDYVREQLDSGDKWDIVGPLKALAGNIFREEFQSRSEDELARISDAEAVGAFKRRMHALRKSAQQDVQRAVDDVMQQIEDSPLSFDGISYGKNLRKFLLEAREMKSDGPSDTIKGQANGSKPLYKKGQGARGKEQESLQESLAALLALYDDRRCTYNSASLALRHLGPLRLLIYIDERAREICSDDGRFTLSSTPALLSKMIEDSDAPFIFEKIGTLINYVMIDEFQDTSRMQWENFKKLLFEKLASGGKGLLVGDIKQSIYRWRSGDWKILYGVEREHELQRFHIRPRSLDTNFRSHQVIVDFNNAFFPHAAELLDAVQPNEEIKLSHIYEDVRQKAKKADGLGYIRVKLSKNGEDDFFCDMAEQIRALQAGGLDLSEIAILVRKNAMTQQLIDGFSQYAPDIHLVSDEAFLLEASTAVQMVVAAMRMLVDKQHADGISEKYLMLHYQRDVLGQPDVTPQSVARQEAEQVLPEAFTAHRDELLQLPLYILAERLWRIFSLSNIQGEDIYMLTFLDELQNHLRGTATPDIQTLLSLWDEKLRLRAVPGSAVTGVRILTIHKAKGLEFHTVLLPFSQWSIESDRQGDILWCKADARPYNELGALPISIHSRDVRNSVFTPDYEAEHLERRVDALDTLYVAFTRAGTNLYVWGKTKPADKMKSITTAGDLIYMTLRNEENDTDDDCFTYEVGSPVSAPALGKCEEKANRLHLKHRDADAIDVKVVTRNPMLDFRQSNQAQDYLQQTNTLSQREIGKRMHEVLSRIDDASQLEDILREARQEGIIGEDEAWDNIVEHVAEGFRNPLVASWFNAKDTVYNECSIAGKDDKGQGCVLRPDRVTVSGNSITVVDYKFGHPSKLYHDQVKAYMKFMRQMYPESRVEGYIWYIMGGKTVRVALPSDSPKGENNNKQHG
ncbi:MAG: UvrD-helicase domain-containing protein [Bacteroidaceae bacterium]|nr:UvrD-helicase domain-containing protein [Bacteroidaceae bacterium]